MQNLLVNFYNSLLWFHNFQKVSDNKWVHILFEGYPTDKALFENIGLIQMQCSPSFDCNWGKQNAPLHVGTSYTNDFRFYSKGNVWATHQIAWAGSLKPKIAWAATGTAPSNPH